MGMLKTIFKPLIQPMINNRKGRAGESKVNSKLNPLIFGKVEHRQINNLILIDDNGKSHQIDHVEIRQNGIFCIETKNYIGLILGTENQDGWTQVLYNGEKNQFFNPLKQNKSHIYHLSCALEKKYKINSLVVIVLTIYSITFSRYLLIQIFQKKDMKTKNFMKRYLIILLIAMVLTLVSSVSEVYLFPFLLKLIIKLYV